MEEIVTENNLIDDLENDDDLEDDDQEGSPDSRSSRGRSRGAAPRGRRYRRVKICNFCVDRVESIDYKDIDTLNRYVSNRGKILPRRQTGACAKHQRAVANAVKRARHVALLPFSGKHTLD
nr:30S ribosomal protein S18 [Anaerolineae bacterium]